MKAIILAAGYATRLYPLTQNKPKPLLSIKGRPLIDYIIRHLANIDEINEIAVVSNQKFFQQFEEWKNSSDFLKKITILNDGSTTEDNRLGAVGDMNFAVENIGNENLLVIAGDNYFEEGIDVFLKFAKEKNLYSAISLNRVTPLSEARKYGVVELDDEGVIIDFQEKPQEPKSDLAAMCLYYFPKEKLSLLKEFQALGTGEDAPGNYINWLCGKDKVYGFIFPGTWYDIGDLEVYEKLNACGRKGRKS